VINIEEITVTPDGRVTFDDAARYLGFSPKTLEQWKARCYGPAAYKIGGKVFYKLLELEEFVGQEVAASTVANIKREVRILSASDK
jgi:hypothetical protein